MDKEKKDELAPEQHSPPSYTPASKGKRIAAWIGVIFMVILVIVYTYSIATGAFLKW